MAKYIIQGGEKLKGKVQISGNKNAVLPCMAAALLTDEEVILRNVPNISDVDVFVEIFQSLGAKIERIDHSVSIKCDDLKDRGLPEHLASKLRASILLVGPLLARFGKLKFFHPGGDVIGKRSIGTHLEGLISLGYKFLGEDHCYQVSRSGGLEKNKEIFFSEASVTATENLVLAAVLGTSVAVVKNCASEPHVVDLCNLLNFMGAQIEGVGTPTLRIAGVSKLHGTDFTLRPDFLEMGTYAIAAAMTRGKIEMENCSLDDLEPVIYPLKRMGVQFEPKNGLIVASSAKVQAFPNLKTNIWPGFPSDMMSASIVLATQAEGASLMHDWMYESRMFFVDKLISMGANITIADPHRVLIYGPTKLYGRNLETPDIRAGMALVLAALTAEGESVINRAELIERGYEDAVKKLASLGAMIERQESRNGTSV